MPGTTPSLPIERYAGTFEHPLLGRVRVAMRDNGPRFDAGPDHQGDLEHWHHNLFMARFDLPWRGARLVTFQLDEEAIAKWIHIYGDTFERID